jgi:uncharacterized protein involved in tolerance to divalent cations
MEREIQDMDYVTITTFATDKQKVAIIEDIRLNTDEEVPMVVFTSIDESNSELMTWVRETLA